MARILIIEDNPTNLELMQYLLTQFGYTPESETDGEAGLRRARQEPFDLILCDVHLPRKDGYEVARSLKSTPQLRSIPLIAVTALAMVGDREKLLGCGFDGYIGKPIDPERFVEQIEGFLPARSGHHHAPLPRAAALESDPGVLPSKGAILVVDDNRTNLELMRSLLEPSGYDVWDARSAADGLKLLNERTPDLIISDVHMADHSGLDFLRGVKADRRWRDIPFMFLSSTAEPRDPSFAGADVFVARPIDPQELLRVIHATMSGVTQ